MYNRLQCITTHCSDYSFHHFCAYMLICPNVMYSFHRENIYRNLYIKLLDIMVVATQYNGLEHCIKRCILSSNSTKRITNTQHIILIQKYFDNDNVILNSSSHNNLCP